MPSRDVNVQGGWQLFGRLLEGFVELVEVLTV